MRRGCAPSSLAILLLIIGVLLFQFRSSGSQPERLSINELSDEMKQGRVVRLIVEKSEVEIIFRDGMSAATRIEEDKTLVEQLLDLGISEEMLSGDSVIIEVKDPGLFDSTYFVPFLIFGGLGFIAGALVMLMLARSGYIPMGERTDLNI